MANIPFLNNAYFAGKVGIGTASPSEKLEVDGRIKVQTSAGSLTLQELGTSSVTIAGSGTVGIQAASNFRVKTNYSNEAFTVLNTGNVGIGTTSPSYPLDVVGDGIRLTRNSKTFIFNADFASAGTHANIQSDAGMGLSFSTNASEKMRIASAGNVGIGTTSPSTKLEVNGRITADTHFTSSDSNATLSSSGSGGNIYLRPNGYSTTTGQVHIHTSGNATFAGDVLVEDNLYLTDSGTVRGKIQLNSSDRDDLDIKAVSLGSNMKFFTVDTERMRINSSGNVGIGTTSPNNELEVLGGGSPRISLRTTSETVGEALELGFQVGTSANSSTNSVGIIKSVITQANPSALKGDLVFQTNGGDAVSTKMVIKDSGSVGIGTTSPGAKLEVSSTPSISGAARYELLITEDNTASAGRGGGLAFSRQGTIFGGIKTIQNTSNNDNTTMYFQTRGAGTVANRMVIDELGNVGIGTSSPSANLDILNGTTGASLKLSATTTAYWQLQRNPTTGNLNISDDALGNVMSFDQSTGNVGIGTTSPAYPLDIQSSSTVALRLNNSSNSSCTIKTDNTYLSLQSAGYILASNPILAYQGLWFLNNKFIRSQESDGTWTDILGLDSSNVLKVGTLGNVSSGGDVTFLVSGSEKMRVAANGNVGIGTTSPDYKLQVSGTIAPEGNEVNNLGSSTNRFNQLWTKLIYDINNGRGLTNQVLTSTGSNGIAWVDASTVIGGPYLPLAGGTMSGNTNHGDNVKDKYGTGNDFQIWHDGSNTFLSNEGEGHLNIINTGDDRDIIFKTDDGSGATTSYMIIDGSAEQTIFYKDTRHTDSVVANFGNSNDLQIYHDGSDSYIDDTGTGWLRLRGNGGVILSSYSEGETMLQATRNGSVNLYYDGSKKFETTSTGVTVTGNVNSSTISIDDYITHNGDPDTYFGFPADNEFKLVAGGSNKFAADANAAYMYYQGGVKFQTTSAGVTVTGSLVVSNDITATGDLDVRDIDARDGIFTGNVGIGTTSPDKKLEVSGDIKISGGDYNGLFFENALGTTKTLLYQHASYDALVIKDIVNNADRVTFKNSGNVGIGTTSPTQKLHVDGNTLISAERYYYTAGTGAGFGSDASGNFKIRQNDADLIFGSGNNVGIGTTSPRSIIEAKGNISIFDPSNTLSNGDTLNGLHFYTDEYSYNPPGLRVNTPISKILPVVDSSGTDSFGLSFYTAASDVESSEKLRISSSGNVGIGTTSPSAKLEVEGLNAGLELDALILKNNSTTGGTATVLKFVNSTDSASANNTSYIKSIRNAGNDNDLVFGTYANDRMTIDSLGSVGIGTTSPQSGFKLDVNGSLVTRGSAYVLTELNHYGTNDFSINASQGLTDIKFTAGGAERVRIKRQGNVGIGTTSPSARLHVDGDIRQEGSTYSVSITGGASVTGDNHLDIAANASYLNLRSPNNSIFYRASSDHAFKDAGGSNEYLRIKTSGTTAGNVGIGTTSPSEKLEVDGYARVTALGINSSPDAYLSSLNARLAVGGNIVINTNLPQLYLRANSTSNTSDIRYQNSLKLTNGSGSTHLTVTSSGNVGIGTTSPTRPLSVYRSTAGSVANFLHYTDATAFAGLYINVDNTNNVVELNASGDTASTMAFQTGNAERMRITTTGNVGIGTTSPGYKLDVNGVVRGDRFFVGTNTAASQWAFHARNNNSTADSGLYFNNNSSEIYLRNSSNVIGARIRSNSTSYFNGGDVGIGIASPQERLHVSGETHPSIKLSSSSDGNYNVILNCGYRNEALNLSVGGYKVFTTEGFNTPETTHLYSNNSKALSLASNQAATFTSTVTATNFINSSDERLKENIEEVRDNSVEVNWKTFNFKTEKEQKRYGVIAQELEKTNPEFVRKDSQGFKSVAYIDLLIAKIAELEARIQKLENK